MRPSRTWQAILDGRRNIRFTDVLRVAEAFGYHLHRVAGSHHILKHPRVADVLNLQPDRNGNAKTYQLRQLAAAVERYSLPMED
jgi:predicted RNA binding protein YcfA (HicA-like mRNA interferase family)